MISYNSHDGLILSLLQASQMAGLVGDVKASTAIRDIATMVEVLTGTELFKSLLGANLDTDMLEWTKQVADFVKTLESNPQDMSALTT